jgi:phosphohistidine phosphatase
MELYLLRHGIAEDGAPGQPDEERKLTPEGRKKLREVLRVASASNVAPTLILSSPLVRAMQTAEIASEHLNYKGQIVQTSTLTPDADPKATWDDLRTYRDEAQVLLASHNPFCARLAAYLLATPELAVDFKKGGLMRIDLDQFGPAPRGVLRWYLTPKLADSAA